jgi:excisionase family DNA binding protein
MNHSSKYGVPRPEDSGRAEMVPPGEWKKVDFEAAATGRPRASEAGSHSNEETDMGIANPMAETGVIPQAGRQRTARPYPAGPLLKTEEAAKYLAISPRQVQYLSDRGELPCIKMATSTRYSPADLDEFIDQCRRKGGRP